MASQRASKVHREPGDPQQQKQQAGSAHAIATDDERSTPPSGVKAATLLSAAAPESHIAAARVPQRPLPENSAARATFDAASGDSNIQATASDPPPRRSAESVPWQNLTSDAAFNQLGTAADADSYWLADGSAHRLASRIEQQGSIAASPEGPSSTRQRYLDQGATFQGQVLFAERGKTAAERALELAEENRRLERENHMLLSRNSTLETAAENLIAALNDAEKQIDELQKELGWAMNELTTSRRTTDRLLKLLAAREQQRETSWQRLIQSLETLAAIDFNELTASDEPEAHEGESLEETPLSPSIAPPRLDQASSRRSNSAPPAMDDRTTWSSLNRADGKYGDSPRLREEAHVDN